MPEAVTRLLKRILTAPIFALMAFVFSVFFIGCGEDGAAAAGNRTIEGVVSTPVVVEYDGREHGIAIENTLSGDVISYSNIDGGPYVETEPKFTLPGEYTVYFRVERTGYKPFESSGRLTITKAVLGGISADGVTVIYDGERHRLEIKGLLAGDTVMYSVDGEEFSETAPAFSEVGEYTVYYIVERVGGEYRSSSTVIVLPDISGEYVNIFGGIVCIGTGGATVNGSDYGLSYGADAEGEIGDERFEWAAGVLRFRGVEYARVREGESVSTVTIEGERYYIRTGESTPRLRIVFDDEGATVALGELEIVRIADKNYCENADVYDYRNNVAEVAVSDGASVELSNRLSAPIGKIEGIVVVCDGNEHGGTIAGDTVLYETEGGYSEHSPMYSEVGEYELHAVVLSSEFLPAFVSQRLSIAPDLTGRYYDGTTVIEIDGAAARINGSTATAEYDGKWVIDGESVTATENGISRGGKNYVRATDEERLVCLDIGGKTAVYVKNEIHNATIEWSDGSITVTINSDVSDAVTSSAPRPVSITLNGNECDLIPADGGIVCILGVTELSERVIFIVVR